MAKLLAARVAWAAADNGLQIHGGNGFALEYPISRVLCDARIMNIFEGAAEIQAQVIARRRLDLLGRGAGAGQAGRRRLDGHTGIVKIEHFGGRKAAAEKPLPGPECQVTFRDEPVERFAQRRAADAKFFRQIAFIQPFARLEAILDRHFPDFIVDAVDPWCWLGQQRFPFDRRERD